MRKEIVDNEYLSYGHTQKLCEGKKRCKNCGQFKSEHTNTNCEVRCIHCEDCNHKSISKECPEYSKQYRIKQIMSIENISFLKIRKGSRAFHINTMKNILILEQEIFPR